MFSADIVYDGEIQILLAQLKTEDNSKIVCDADNEKKKEFETLLGELTEREKSIFLLMIGGYTNMQIADKLCLSNGTVKNYISVIYEKLGTKERNVLILKYSCFFEKITKVIYKNDQNNFHFFK